MVSACKQSGMIQLGISTIMAATILSISFIAQVKTRNRADSTNVRQRQSDLKRAAETAAHLSRFLRGSGALAVNYDPATGTVGADFPGRAGTSGQTPAALRPEVLPNGRVKLKIPVPYCLSSRLECSKLSTPGSQAFFLTAYVRYAQFDPAQQTVAEEISFGLNGGYAPYVVKRASNKVRIQIPGRRGRDDDLPGHRRGHRQ